MKRFVLSLALIITTATMAFSQTPFRKGDLVFNFGVGLGNTIYSSNYNLLVPPINFSAEYGVVDGLINGKAGIGVGGYLAYTSAKYKKHGWKYSNTIIGARGVFHMNFVENLDTYGTLVLGYDIASARDNDDIYEDAIKSRFAVELHAGARYYFTPMFAVMAEVGYGVSVLNLGVALRL